MVEEDVEVGASTSDNSRDGIPADQILLASISYFNEHHVTNPTDPLFSVEQEGEEEGGGSGHPSLVFYVPNRDVCYEGEGGTPSLALKTSSFALKKWLRGRALRPKLIYDTRRFSLCDPSYLLRGWWLCGAPSDVLYSNVRILLQETHPSSPSSPPSTLSPPL